MQDHRRLERGRRDPQRRGHRHRQAAASSSHSGGKLTEFEGVEAISPDELLAIPCDVLIPAALGGMIHEGNADSIQCRMMLEGANSPTTPGADEILNDKGVYVIPDVMANAGGVVVSYFEWVQNLQHFRWEEREINDKLGNIMRRAFREVDAAARGAQPARGRLRGRDRARDRDAPRAAISNLLTGRPAPIAYA